VVRGRAVTKESAGQRRERWSFRGTSLGARQLAAQLGTSTLLGEMLLRLGYREVAACRRFLDPKLADLSPPDQMRDRLQLAQRLALAIRQRERICIFGDYDCDGITAAAILFEACQRLGGQVSVELASRFDGGYGLGAAAIDRVLSHSPALVVTCDCGSSDHDGLRRLSALGIDCLVIDHHLVPDEPLPALAFLNPHRPECGFPFKGLASCGLALSVVAELRAQLNTSFDLRTLLDLVAIGTIADVAPLTGDNRALVRAGLKLIESQQRPGLAALMRRARFEPGHTVTAEDVAFRIAPRLNAPGRLASPMPSLRLLLAQSEDEAETLMDEIEAYQTERRKQQDAMLADAEAEIAANAWQSDAAVVVGKADYNVGIVGIVAGKLADRYGCPVVVYGCEGGVARGSVRGPAGVPLFELVQTTADCLNRYGGHHAAAGLELALARIPEFRQRFVQAAEAHRARSHGSATAVDAREVLLLHPTDEVMRVAQELLLLEPCGEGNRLPLVGIQGRLSNARDLRGGHLRLELERSGGDLVGGFGPNLGDRAGKLAASLVAVGSLRISTFAGKRRAELLVSEVMEWNDEIAPGETGNAALLLPDAAGSIEIGVARE
jgi:single-stranded-DNA-specific exonuclease